MHVNVSAFKKLFRAQRHASVLVLSGIEDFRILAAGLYFVMKKDLNGFGPDVHDLISIPIYNTALLIYLDIDAPYRPGFKRRP